MPVDFDIDTARRIARAVLEDERDPRRLEGTPVSPTAFARPVVLGRIVDAGFRFEVVRPVDGGASYEALPGVAMQWAMEFNGQGVDTAGGLVFAMSMLGVDPVDGRLWWGFAAAGGEVGDVYFPVQLSPSPISFYEGRWSSLYTPPVNQPPIYVAAPPAYFYEVRTVSGVLILNALQGGIPVSYFSPTKSPFWCRCHPGGAWGVAYRDTSGDVQLFDAGEVPDFAYAPIGCATGLP